MQKLGKSSRASVCLVARMIIQQTNLVARLRWIEAIRDNIHMDVVIEED